MSKQFSGSNFPNHISKREEIYDNILYGTQTQLD